MVETNTEVPAPRKTPVPTDPAERLQAAEKLRESGNASFKAGNHAAAKQSYEATLKLLQTGPPPGGGDFGAVMGTVDSVFDFGEMTGQAKAAKVAVLLNIALCCLKAEPCDASGALDRCEEALDLEPENVKAMYRKGKALIELGEMKEAEWELARAVKLAPQDPAIRKDLTQLRRDEQARRENQKKTYEGLFERGPGFASDGREEEAEVSRDTTGSSYLFMKEPTENVYATSERPFEEALELQSQGKLQDAIYALEAAISQTSRSEDWPAHFAQWLELGRLFMDINFDALALRCLNAVTEEPKAYAPVPPVTIKQHALLLRAICLLNEAEDDPKAEVTKALEIWFAQAGPEEKSGISLNSQLEEWRASSAAQAGADAAVAHGLLHLVYGRDETLQAFADAIAAADTTGSYFGDCGRRSTRWNMLGAVLANRNRHEHALLAYERAVHYQAHYPRALQNRAIALAARGDHVEAVASCAAALGIVPDFAAPPVWQMLEKQAKDQVQIDGLVEAAEMRFLSKVQTLVQSSSAAPALDQCQPTDLAVLTSIGLAPAA